MDYTVEMEYRGKLVGIASGATEDEAIENALKGDLTIGSRDLIEGIRSTLRIEPTLGKYKVRWTEEKESVFYAPNQGVAEWRAFCADDSELTNRTHTITMVEKLED